ncbi:FecR domain-containing protein [uncultured Draconibacterium sp.]|uniref:FecR family protein n=1 Tax=uncultured Draconibacterium sp. TaxID=1573823 RepID=UPI003217CBE1
MDNNSILKYLQGKASEKEKELFFRWLEESPEHKEEFSAVKKIWALSAKYKNTEGTIWADLKPVVQPEKKTHKHFIRILKQAAIFIILVGCGALAQFYISQKADNNQTVYADSFSVKAPLGQMTNLELPDGTLVMLNSGTTISYSGDFTSGNRQVYLQGEAFFDVQKDVDHPFIVNSEFLGVKVYGTSFNIQAYPEDRTFAATLVEGSIGLLDANGEEVTKLVPGEKACFDESGTNIEIKQVDTAMYTSWKEGLVTYRNERLEDIAKQIERWYNVEIVIQKEGLGDERYFGTILKNKPIDQILEVLKLTTSLQYEIVPRANKPSLIYWK